MSSNLIFNPAPLAWRLSQDGEVQLRLTKLLQADTSPWGVPAYLFDIVLDEARAGALSLRIGDSSCALFYAGHVGYAVFEDFRGRGLARTAVMAVMPLAVEHGLSPLWFTCEPQNAASIKTIESLGAVLVETVDLPATYDSYARGERQKRRYRLDP